jgi:hypothetical protein
MSIAFRRLSPCLRLLGYCLLCIVPLRGQTLMLTASPNPVTFGQAATLTATITPGATGKVTFFDGATVLGVSTLSGGRAMLTTTMLATGTRALQAHYSGDATNAASNSNSLSQVVRALPGTGLHPTGIYSTNFNGSPNSVGIGDFNGDGKPDLAVPNFTYPSFNINSVSIMLNNGDGTFRLGQTYPAGTWPIDVVVADFNGDGKADLLAMGIPAGYTSAVFLGNGDETFQPSSPPYLPGGRAVAVADFNGDGNADLLIVGAVTNGYALLLGNGDATFQAPIFRPTAISPWSVAIGDFNRDGKQDLAIAYLGGGMTVQFGNGDGTFQPWTFYYTPAIGPNDGATSVVVADFNGDGNLDLAVACPGGSRPNGNPGYVIVFLGKGDGTFQAPLGTPVAGGAYTLAVGDFNGDARPDLAIANSYGGSVSLALGNGDGTFGSPLNYAAALQPFGVKVLEANGDGVADLIVASPGGDTPNGTGMVSVFLGSASIVQIDSPSASSTVNAITSVSGWAIVAAGDSPITSVPVTVDGVLAGNATYGISRPDVCAVYQGRPGCPNVGYSFSLNTALLTPGPHSITVLATNNDVTNTGYASVTVNVGIQPPTVWIDGPANGSTVSGTIVVSGWVLDNTAMVGTGISSVKVKVDSAAPVTAAYGVNRADVCGALPGRPGCPNVGYSLAINTLALSAGQHTITVTAVDSDGYTDVGSETVTVRVNNMAPTVWIDAPAANSTVSGTVTVSGWAIDNASIVGTALGSVQVLVDGLVVGNATYGTSRPDVCSALPGRPGCPNVGYTFALNTAGWSAGPHVITVSTTDSDGTGEVGLASVTVTTAANATAPTVWIDSPAAGATVSGAVIISGWALDNASAVGSAITSVQVLVDGVPVGNATYGTSRPDVCSALPGRPGCPNVGYTFTLNSGTLTLGSHTITVKAIDSDATPDAGAASATVTINTAPATVWIDQPLPGAVSGTVTISGWAINSASGVGTAISGVQVLLDGAVVGSATYGTSRPDVCGALPGRPNCPNVGYTFALNTGNLSPGQHVITVTAVDSDKVPQSGSASVTVTVNNGPPLVWIDQPLAGATVSGTVMVSGWVVDNGTVVGTPIVSVQVKLDTIIIGTAAYGLSRPDVCAVYVGRPGCPNVGYSFPWNTSGGLGPGVHILTVTATDANGNADVGNASVVVIK